jgi:cytochrome b involved in lipid metabolism
MAAGSAGATFSLADVAKHNKQKDCWIAVNGGVYDATKFLDDHPGGGDIIMQHAGQDATNDFTQIHSRSAFKLLETLRVGSLPDGEGVRVAAGKAGEGGGGGGGSALSYLFPILLLGAGIWYQFLGGAQMLSGSK